nr:E3 ubiquitin-protein ligase UPL4 isoform X1 [Ipomoea batatas]
MENRGQKRTDKADELPADKRACSSLEFRASSSNSSVQTPQEGHDGDMDTSSSTSGSTRSDGEGERDSYGSCDSDNSYRDYYRRRSLGDQSKFRNVLTSLTEESEESGQLAALTELCELLSFCTDSSLSSLMADSFSPVLVRLARHEHNPDIMLLAIRALTYLCDVHPRSSGFLVRHDAVPALCQRLMAIEYLDVAEQCLQAMEKISQEQPLACLQSGAIMAVLNYIDFFSTSVQRVALSTVLNICKKLPSENPSPFMDAVPILCNLLQYEDKQLVESVASCLIKIVEQVCHSLDMLEELCKHGLVQQATHLIDLNSRTTLCQPVYIGLIGLLVKLASGSIVAVKTLFDLNISSIVCNILSIHDLSHGMPSTAVVDGQHNQVHEVLKLLHELLPPIAREQEIQPATEKESFLMNRPDLLQKFGIDLLPVLLQVVNSGANLYVCYGCLSIINKLVYFSNSDMLVELLQGTNLASFLAGVFTRKDHHVVMLALQIVDTLLQKLSDVFLNPFVKEGVVFAVDALLSPEKSSQFMFPVSNGAQLSSESSKTSAPRGAQRCLCFAFGVGQSSTNSESGSCKLEIETVQNLAQHIKTNYFAAELMNPEKGLTDVLQKLRTLSSALTDLVNKYLNDVDDSYSQHESGFYDLLHQIMSQLNGKNSISTFEFIESGIVKSVVNYLSNGQYLIGKTENVGALFWQYSIEKRFEVFGRLLLSSSDPSFEDLPFLSLIHLLQSALSSVENFPVISSHTSRLRNSYATIPYGRCTSYPCLKVQFVKGEGETDLCDYLKDVVNVDPFSSLDTIEGYLSPKVRNKKAEHSKSPSQAMEEEGSASQLSPDLSPSQVRTPDAVELDSIRFDVNQVQLSKREGDDIASSAPVETANTEQANTDPMDITDVHMEPLGQSQLRLSEENSIITECPQCSNEEGSSMKLLFYLEGQKLNNTLTLYQAILQQQIEAENDAITNAKVWNQVHRITYKSSVRRKQSCAQKCHHETHHSALHDKHTPWQQYTPFFSNTFASAVVDIDRSNPTYDILSLLRSLEQMNRFRYHLISRERVYAFAEERTNDLDNLKFDYFFVPQTEFVNNKLTDKLEQQMRDPFAVSVGGLPYWCTQLMDSCPFLFGFEARCKYFRLAILGNQPVQQPQLPSNNSGGLNRRQLSNGGFPRKRFMVHRNKILDSASQMMDLYASQKVVIEVEYSEEVGTGLGPTLEFYTLVSHEFQKSGLGLWRGDCMPSGNISLVDDAHGSLSFAFGLFPRPWSQSVSALGKIEFSEVLKKFVLLGQIVAKSLQDGRVLDLPFSKAFYKLILGKELSIYDIPSFDPELGRTLLEFHALAERKKHVESLRERKSTLMPELYFRNTKIEDLCLDFSLPGYPDYILTSDSETVDLSNLEEYVSLIVNASIGSGVSRQVESFKSGFDQVFPIKHLQIFSEEELERLLCGEREIWNSNELVDHIKFDHGYTASSSPAINLLEIIQEFNIEKQRAFLQFVTGAPRLPPGGLASLNPKLTIVRKKCSKWADDDLPSVMTCANYLKLPPYTTKEKMKEKLLYAITEGQGSFFLS